MIWTIIGIVALVAVIAALGAAYRYRRGLRPSSHGPAAGGN